MSRLQLTFKNAAKPVFVCYVTGGYPEGSTVDSLLQLQQSGCDVLEIGVPFSDPIADGKVIQKSSFKALELGITLKNCLEFVKLARQKGLVIPVVLMGYYNPFLNYGDSLFQDCMDVGVDGFIIVDLPPEEAFRFRSLAVDYGYIPLITPTTSTERIKKLVSIADSFIYVVSVSGVTGGRATVSTELPSLVSRIKQFTSVPLAVGFGVSNREQFLEISKVSQGVVIGSRLVMEMEKAFEEGRNVPLAAGAFAREITQTTTPPNLDFLKNASTSQKSIKTEFEIQKPSLQALFGNFGGQYAPEALVDCLTEIEHAFNSAIKDESFWTEFKSYYSYMNRESPLHLADRLSQSGAQIYLKREDLNHTGSHKINNALGQALLAKRLGKTRIIAETGAGQHGVATATVCAKLGLECIIYMGEEDCRRQALNVFRIKLLGAKVVPVDSGSKTLKDAINEAMRDWVSNVKTTHYIIGSAIGPYPFPVMVREFQSVIGKESRKQMLELTGSLPDIVVACVGGGSNAIGMFYPFVNDESVRLIGVEAGGDGIKTGKHSATLTMGRPGVLHGTRTYLMQDENGQIIETHSISAGLDYPGVGPEHAYMKDSGRAEYMVCDDDDAMRGFRILSQQEGIIPALETAHAVFVAVELAKTLSRDKKILICVSGRGDKDVQTVAEVLPKIGPKIDWDLRFEA